MAGTVARVVLGAVLLVAGALKIADRAWPLAARAFGAPRWAVPVVPAVELIVGGLLVAQLGRPVPALIAVFVLCAFTTVVVLHLVRGDRVPCGCFGSASSRPVGSRTLIRNLVLIGVATVAAL